MPKGQLSIAALMGRQTEAPAPVNGAMPGAVVCRDSIRAEAAGVSAESRMSSAHAVRHTNVSTSALAAGYRQRERSPSIIDQSEAHLSMVREIRENYRVSTLSRPSVQGVLHDVIRSIPHPERQLLSSELGDLQGALRRMLQSVFNSSGSRSTVSQQGTSPSPAGPDTQQLSVDPSEEPLVEEEDGRLVVRPGRMRSLLGRVTEFGGALMGECVRLIRNLPRYVGKLLRGLKEGMERLSRKGGDFYTGGILSPPATPPLAGAPTSPKHGQDSLQQWSQRFGEDPREKLKETVQSVSKVLEEISRARLEEKARDRLAQEQMEEHERVKMNRLRDLLASLLVPMDDGIVPLSLLSRHFIGPWRTDDDLRAAIARARQAKHQLNGERFGGVGEST